MRSPTAQGALFSVYLELHRMIEKAWIKPEYRGPGVPTITIALEIDRTGRLITQKVISASEYEPLDRSVMKAVMDARPFPPFPQGMEQESIEVRVAFDLTADRERPEPSPD